MTLPKPIEDRTERSARARQDASRQLLLEILSSRPADVRSLAGELHVHTNAIRQHLQVLERAGLVHSEVEHGSGRVGRPRTLYRASRRELAAPPFERLAALLVRVAEGQSPADVGRAEGITAAGSKPWLHPADAIADVAARGGFSVRVDRQGDVASIDLDGCPFASVAGPVVCNLHRGIVDGASRAANGAVRSFEIHDPARRPCRVTVERLDAAR